MADELVNAAAYNRVDDVVTLLKSGVDPNARNDLGKLTLLEASDRGSVRCVKVLTV